MRKGVSRVRHPQQWRRRMAPRRTVTAMQPGSARTCERHVVVLPLLTCSAPALQAVPLPLVPAAARRRRWRQGQAPPQLPMARRLWAPIPPCGWVPRAGLRRAHPQMQQVHH